MSFSYEYIRFTLCERLKDAERGIYLLAAPEPEPESDTERGDDDPTG